MGQRCRLVSSFTERDLAAFLRSCLARMGLEDMEVNAQMKIDSGPGTQVRDRLVVIGNGMAGCRAVEEILARDPDRFDITIFGAEARVNYNRIMLSPVLAGEKTFDEIVINDDDLFVLDHAI